jgi:hypothetical protein
MLNPAAFTAAVHDRLLVLLAPLFLTVVAGDTEAARNAARDLLASYNPRNNRDLRLAALAIAFSFGALDALSRAADPDLPINQILRLRGNASALNRAAHQNETRLDKRTGEPDTAAPDEPTDLPASSKTEDLAAYVRPAPPAPQPSRQQRRFAERHADKQREREQESARLEERVARRMAEKAEAARLAAGAMPHANAA